MASSAARRQERPGLLTERLGEPPAAAALVALELHVAGASAGPELAQLQRPCAGDAAVQELDPREVVEVPVRARHQVASGERRRWPSGARPRAAVVDVAGALRPPRFGS